MAITEKMIIDNDWITPIRFENGENITPKAVADAIQIKCDEAGIPVAFLADQLKTGPVFARKVEDVLVMYHPQHRNDYLRFGIRVQHQGRYAFVNVANLGGSKNFYNANVADSGSKLKQLTNMIGGIRQKLQEEEQYYAILKDCVESALS